MSFRELHPLVAREDKVRAERDRRLREDVDSISSLRLAAMTDEEKALWEAYRDALLEVPQKPGFPETINWPDKPE